MERYHKKQTISQKVNSRKSIKTNRKIEDFSKKLFLQAVIVSKRTMKMISHMKICQKEERDPRKKRNINKDKYMTIKLINSLRAWQILK